MKKCTICKIEKDNSSFNKNKVRKDGLNNICKTCSKERSRKYYNDNKEHHKKIIRERNINIIKNNQIFILNYLKDKSCKDCGNNDLRVLEFDHLPKFKKDYNISTLIGGHSLDKLKDEILKCEVVCCNCHRIRTIERAKKNYRK